MKTCLNDYCIWSSIICDGTSDEAIDEPTNYGLIHGIMALIWGYYDDAHCRVVYGDAQGLIFTQILTFSSRKVNVT